MEDKNTLKLNSNTSLANEELFKILNDLNIIGEIYDKNHPLALYMKEKGKKQKKSKIKYSYTKSQTVWREFKKEEDKIYLFRITKKIDNTTKDLIRNEFKIHKECENLNNISPEFICYHFSDFINFSVFMTKNFYTLEELIEQKNYLAFQAKILL